MKRLELLIEEARELSGNQRYDSDSGISQAVFVRYFKNAQDTLQKAIAVAKSKLLLTEEEITIVAGQEEYDYPSDIYLQAIDTMEYSDDNGNTWRPLNKAIIKDRSTASSGAAYGYVPRENGFILTPPLANGIIRVNYIKKLPLLEKRSGYISAVTTVGGQITAITLDVSETSFDATYLNKQNYLCIVDKFGDRKVKNVLYTSVNSGTGVITLPSNHTLGDGESVAVGDYITVGEDTYNRPDLEDICESFLIDYSVYSAKFGDMSKWTAEAIQQMNMNLSSLIESFARPNDDITQIPITNTDFLYIG